jgi:hypothetical protein
VFGDIDRHGDDRGAAQDLRRAALARRPARRAPLPARDDRCRRSPGAGGADPSRRQEPGCGADRLADRRRHVGLARKPPAGDPDPAVPEPPARSSLREKLGEGLFAAGGTIPGRSTSTNGGKVLALAQTSSRKSVPIFFADCRRDRRTTWSPSRPVRRAGAGDRAAQAGAHPRNIVSSAFFHVRCWKGRATNPRKYAIDPRSVLKDYTVTTPAEMQALAVKYLRAGQELAAGGDPTGARHWQRCRFRPWRPSNIALKVWGGQA